MPHSYILILYFPTFINNSIFFIYILFSLCLLRSFNSMYLCYQNLPGIYKPPVLSKLFIHRPASTWTTPLQDRSQLLYRFYWRFPYPVYRYCSCTALLVSTKRTAASCFSWMFPCPVDRCCSCAALLVSTKRTAALP